MSSDGRIDVGVDHYERARFANMAHRARLRRMQDLSFPNLEPLAHALAALQEVLKIPTSSRDLSEQRVFRDSTIKRFELAYEMSWKTMKRALEYIQGDVLDDVGRRDLFRLADEANLIDNPLIWANYHEARNLSSHIYEEVIADRVLDVIEPFVKDAEKLLKALKARPEYKNKNV